MTDWLACQVSCHWILPIKINCNEIWFIDARQCRRDYFENTDYFHLCEYGTCFTDLMRMPNSSKKFFTYFYINALNKILCVLPINWNHEISSFSFSCQFKRTSLFFVFFYSEAKTIFGAEQSFAWFCI